MLRIDQFDTKKAAVAYLKKTRDLKTSKEAERLLLKRLPKEAYYQSRIINCLKDQYPDAFVWKAAAGPYSRKGVPDVCAVIGGRFYGFEVKRPYIGVLSEIQKQTMERIRAAGGIAEVVCFPEDVKKIIDKEGQNECGSL